MEENKRGGYVGLESEKFFDMVKEGLKECLLYKQEVGWDEDYVYESFLRSLGNTCCILTSYPLPDGDEDDVELIFEISLHRVNASETQLENPEFLFKFWMKRKYIQTRNS